MTNDDTTTPGDDASEKTSTDRKDAEWNDTERNDAERNDAERKTSATPETTSTKDSAPDERPAETREPADAIKAELDDLRDQAARRGKRSQRLSRTWATAHMFLGIAAAVLAVLATGVVMSARVDDGYAVAGILVAAGLVLIMTFVHPDARGAHARMTARGWNALEVDLHVFLVAEYDGTMPDERKDILRSAMARTLDLLAGRYENTESRRS